MYSTMAHSTVTTEFSTSSYKSDKETLSIYALFNEDAPPLECTHLQPKKDSRSAILPLQTPKHVCGFVLPSNLSSSALYQTKLGKILIKPFFKIQPKLCPNHVASNQIPYKQGKKLHEIMNLKDCEKQIQENSHLFASYLQPIRVLIKVDVEKTSFL